MTKAVGNQTCSSQDIEFITKMGAQLASYKLTIDDACKLGPLLTKLDENRAKDMIRLSPTSLVFIDQMNDGTIGSILSSRTFNEKLGLEDFALFLKISHVVKTFRFLVMKEWDAKWSPDRFPLGLESVKSKSSKVEKTTIKESIRNDDTDFEIIDTPSVAASKVIKEIVNENSPSTFVLTVNQVPKLIQALTDLDKDHLGKMVRNYTLIHLNNHIDLTINRTIFFSRDRKMDIPNEELLGDMTKEEFAQLLQLSDVVKKVCFEVRKEKQDEDTRKTQDVKPAESGLKSSVRTEDYVIL